MGCAEYDLTDFEWRVIAPLLPNKPRGVPRVDDRRVLNGIFWVLRSGAPWRDLPERYGPRRSCGIHILTHNDFGEIVAPDQFAAFLDPWALCVETSEIMDARTTELDAITRTDCERHILAFPMTLQS